MHFILHDFADSAARQILYNTATAMVVDQSILLLNEIVLPPRQVPLQMALWDVHMMTVLGGRERSEKEWRELLDSVPTVRLEIVRIWSPPDGLGEGIIEVIRRE